MCFHSALTTESKNLKNRYKAELENFKSQKHINAFQNTTLPIITNLTQNTFQFFEWGLIPAWASFLQASQLRLQTPNARIETVLEKPSFRDAIQTQRCLVPATGFFEWQHFNHQKYPFFISLKETEIFSFAGIWSNWLHPNGKTIQTFSILTTQANELMARIHNTKQRMPVILKPEDETKWLNEGHLHLKYFAEPFGQNSMKAQSIQFDESQENYKNFEYAALSQQQMGLF